MCFSSHGSQAPVRCLWGLGLVALQPVGFSQTRDLTCIPCTDWWILNHWTTREFFLSFFFFSVWKEAGVWSYWSHPCDIHGDHLRTPTFFSSLNCPQGTLSWGCSGWRPLGCNNLCLLTWQVKLLSPKESVGEDGKWNWGRMSTESPLDAPAHWVTQMRQGKHCFTKIYSGSWSFSSNYQRASL